MCLKPGDIVIDKYNKKGTVLKLHKTGQILVQQRINVFCTYDNKKQLLLIEGV